MNTPGSAIGGSATMEGESKAVDVRMEGKELKVLSPAYLQKLIDQKLDFPQLKSKLEGDFPGYTLPTEEDIKTLKLNDKHENLAKISEGVNAGGSRFNIVTYDGVQVSRSRWSVSNGSHDQRDMDTRDRQYKHLKEEDCLFLIKKTNN